MAFEAKNIRYEELDKNYCIIFTYKPLWCSETTTVIGYVINIGPEFIRLQMSDPRKVGLWNTLLGRSIDVFERQQMSDIRRLEEKL